jgi:hypothetical protein
LILGLVRVYRVSVYIICSGSDWLLDVHLLPSEDCGALSQIMNGAGLKLLKLLF